jgi:hypothetical protein
LVVWSAEDEQEGDPGLVVHRSPVSMLLTLCPKPPRPRSEPRNCLLTKKS